jgi:hypothetical protein
MDGTEILETSPPNVTRLQECIWCMYLSFGYTEVRMHARRVKLESMPRKKVKKELQA